MTLSEIGVPSKSVLLPSENKSKDSTCSTLENPKIESQADAMEVEGIHLPAKDHAHDAEALREVKVTALKKRNQYVEIRHRYH